ncbi:MAG: DUF362 domain-containing protein [Nanoarchaeota archaeon]|nr:DUF362 domain-containing protein [Nanoarchaeota archaeon]
MVRIIRWVGEKSGKKWIYPVEEDIYTHEKTKKVVSKKAKVVGFTKVNIPSPLHPIIPYNVLILEDVHGHKMPKKVMKDYAMGDTYEDAISDKENAFAIVKLKYDYEEAVDEALELIGGITITPNQKILIKPNLSVPGNAYLGTCTNDKTLDALLIYLLKQGAKPANITIAEQSFFLPFEKAIAKTGILEVVKKHKVKLVNIADTKFEEKKEREFTFKISKIAQDHDIVINVPVIKTDMILGMDGAFENLTRFLHKESYEQLAKDPLKAVMALAILPKLLPPFITLGDASIGMQGNGPAQHGEPGFFNMIFAARNPVVHDRVASEVLCLSKLPYAELAGKVGVGEFELDNIEVLGNELEAVRRDILKPTGSRLFKKS